MAAAGGYGLKTPKSRRPAFSASRSPASVHRSHIASAQSPLTVLNSAPSGLVLDFSDVPFAFGLFHTVLVSESLVER